MWRYRQLSIGWLSVCTKLKIKEFSNIPQTPNQQSMKEFLNDLGVKGDAPGVCWDSLGVIFFCAPHMDTMISYAMSVEEMDIDYRCKYVYPHISIYIYMYYKHSWYSCILVIHQFFLDKDRWFNTMYSTGVWFLLNQRVVGISLPRDFSRKL